MNIPLHTTLTAALLFVLASGPAFAVNVKPVINPIPPLSVTAGGVLSYKVTATDANLDPITLTATGLKSWMSFSGGTFTATPSVTTSGAYTIKFIASDGKSQSTASATLTVIAVNSAPTFGALTSKTVVEGGTLTTLINATDPNADVVTITASGLKSWMTFDGKTLTLKPGFSDSGNYTVTFSASDGKLATIAPLTVTVTNVNQAPVISTIPALSVAEGKTLSYKVIATDPDGDVVTVTAIGLKSWMSFSGSTLTATPGYEDAGTYTVNLSATDGSKQVSSSLTLTINATNRAPVLDTIGSWVVGESKVLSRPISATDPDGDAVTITAAGLQSWMSFDGRHFHANPLAGTRGTYSVSFVASDKALSDTKTITVTVTTDGASFPLPWNEYFGSVGSGASWASWSRNSLFGTTGISLVWDPSKLTDLVTTVTGILQTSDVMVPVVGFSVGAPGDYTNLWSYLDLIQDGGTASYEQAVRSQLEALAPLDPSGKRIIYQMGNEVSQYSYSEGVRLWAAGRGISIPGVAAQYDPDYIAYYVEYHVAPTVEALLAASATAYGDASKVTIALGSIDSGGSVAGRAWLDQLLSYKVQGTFAPSLAGKYVYELVDLATVHYVGGTVNLEPTWDKWNGVGTIRGLWTTEEIGHMAAATGRGAGKAIRTVADHLNWYYKRGLNQEQARIALYDWNLNGPVAGTSADTVMLVFFDFFGAASLEPRTDVVTTEMSSGQVESYQLQSLSENKRVITMSFKDGAATVSGVLFDKQGWTGVVDGTLHVFSANGHTVSSVTVTDVGANYQVNLAQPIQLWGDGDGVLITLKLY